MDSPGRDVALRTYIDFRMKEYVGQLQKLTRQFSKDKEKWEESASRAKAIRGELRNMIKIFEEVLRVPSHLRQQVANVKGMSSQQITDKKSQLQKLLAQYEKMSLDEFNQQQNKSQALNTDLMVMSDSLKDLSDAEPLTETSIKSTNNKIGRFLLVLQGVSYVSGLIAIIISFYNLAIK